MKLAAAALMVVDHVGFAIHYPILSVVGKLSFPLFVWLMITGQKQTSNFNKYQFRLLLLAIVSQPITYFFYSLPILNLVFSLWLSLHFIDAINSKKYIKLFAAVIGSFFVAYGIYGIALAFFMSVAPFPLQPEVKKSRRINFDEDPVIENIQIPLWAWAFAFLSLHVFQSLLDPYQIHAVYIILAIPFLTRIKSRGPKARWFYWFYPLHFIPLMFLAHQF